KGSYSSGQCYSTTCEETWYSDCRYFTSDIKKVKCWLDPDCAHLDPKKEDYKGGFIGVGNPCNIANERILEGVEIAMTPRPSNAGSKDPHRFMPPKANTNKKFRPGTNVLIILIGDADDQGT